VDVANYECNGNQRVHAELVREGETAGRDQIAGVCTFEATGEQAAES
jgi:hypothetical protein